MAKMTAEAANQARNLINKGFIKVTLKNCDAVVYYGINEDGSVSARGYVGASIKAKFFNLYTSLNAAAKLIAKWQAELQKDFSFKQDLKKARKEFKHTLVEGDILKAIWGYDQTNVDYYQVTRVVGGASVEIRKICKVREETGYMSGTCAPAPGEFISEPMIRRVGNGNCVRVDCATASPAKFQEIAGIKVYGVDEWTAYA